MEIPARESKNKILLREKNKKLFNTKIISDLKIKEKTKKMDNFSLNEIYEESMMIEPVKDDKDNTLTNENKSFETNTPNEENQVLIDEFIEEFEIIKSQFNERNINLKKVKGDKLGSKQMLRSIKEHREKVIKTKNKKFVDDFINESDFRLNKHFPIYDRSIQPRKPNWNYEEIDDDCLKGLHLNKLITFVNKLIIKKRATKRLDKFIAFKRFQNQKSIKKKVILSGLNSEEFVLNEKQSYTFDFNEISIGQTVFPSHNDAPIQHHSIKLIDLPIIWSEDLLNLNEIKRNDVDVEVYENINPFKNYIYQPFVGEFKSKLGAEEEYGQHTEILSYNTLKSNYNSVSEKIKYKAQICLRSEKQLFDELEEEKIDYECIKNDSNSIKLLSSQIETTEVGLNRFFIHKPIIFPDYVLVNYYDDLKMIKRQYISSANGYNFMKILIGLKSEKFRYFVHKYCKKREFFGESDIDKCCKRYIRELEIDDKKYLEDLELILQEKRLNRKTSLSELDSSTVQLLKSIPDSFNFSTKETDFEKFVNLKREFNNKLEQYKLSSVFDLLTFFSDLNKYIRDPKNKLMI